MRIGKIQLVIALLAASAITAPGITFAAAKTEAVAGPDCSYESRFQKLHAIQTDGTYNYVDGIRAQLEVRKSILFSIIDCAMLNVEKRREELKKTAPEFQNSKVQNDIARGLTDAANYYAYKRTIVPDLGIQGTQDLAAEILAWRAGTYAPLASRQDNFEIWAQNQPLFAKTGTRFSMISPIILSLAVLNRDDIQKSFESAQMTFNWAEDLNAKARAALDQGDPEAGPLIKSSLASLSDVYKKFMEISGQVKKIVP